MSRGAEARLDLNALVANLQRVRELAPGRKVMAIIKANAYGHGLVRSGRALAASADAFGVASSEEAWALRMGGIKQPINLLEGFFETEELATVDEHRLDITVHHVWQVNALAKARLQHPVNVWLKVDSGMHRLGIAPDLVADAIDHLKKSKKVGRIGLLTHLANADDGNDPSTQQQLQVFAEATRSIKGERCIANSAGIVAWPDSHADWVRPGIMLYGASPMLGQRGADHGLAPVMTLRSRLIAVNHFKKGERVGYGGQWQCPEAMPVGVVAIGYGDGYPRHAREGTPVLIRGQRVAVIGRVSMDMVTVDLRGISQPRIGEEVTLWGEGLPVEEVAECAGTIAYELLCGVTPRVRVVEA